MAKVISDGPRIGSPLGEKERKTMIELSVILFAFVVGALILICAPQDDDEV
jgi:hypothetical protein